jgi:hypothetical protein
MELKMNAGLAQFWGWKGNATYPILQLRQLLVNDRPTINIWASLTASGVDIIAVEDGGQGGVISGSTVYGGIGHFTSIGRVNTSSPITASGTPVSISGSGHMITSVVSCSEPIHIQGGSFTSQSLAGAIAGADNLGHHTASVNLNLNGNKLYNGIISCSEVTSSNIVSSNIVALNTGSVARLNITGTQGSGNYTSQIVFATSSTDNFDIDVTSQGNSTKAPGIYHYYGNANQQFLKMVAQNAFVLQTSSSGNVIIPPNTRLYVNDGSTAGPIAPESITVGGNVSASSLIDTNIRYITGSHIGGTSPDPDGFIEETKNLDVKYGARGEIIYGTGNINVSQAGPGRIVYRLNNTNQWQSANSGSDIATKMLGIVCGTNANIGGLLIRGMFNLGYDPGGNEGDPLYLAADASASATITTTEDHYARIIGYKFSPTRGGNTLIYFCPDNTWVKL